MNGDGSADKPQQLAPELLGRKAGDIPYAITRALLSLFGPGIRGGVHPSSDREAPPVLGDACRDGQPLVGVWSHNRAAEGQRAVSGRMCPCSRDLDEDEQGRVEEGTSECSSVHREVRSKQRHPLGGMVLLGPPHAKSHRSPAVSIQDAASDKRNRASDGRARRSVS